MDTMKKSEDFVMLNVKAAEYFLKKNQLDDDFCHLRRVIDGKLYDTSTAKYICMGNYWNERVSKDFYEYLFIKKTGEFFRYDDKWTDWGNINNFQKIVPLTEGEARAWVENFCNERYEEIFGEVQE